MRKAIASMTVVAALVAGMGVFAAAPAGASGKGDSGPRGNRIVVSQVRNLNAYGDTVVVRGRGFDETVGIYVALCVTPRPGQMPSPCGGGINQGGSPASAWISSNPPPYGVGLADPYRPGGRFRVSISVRSQIGAVDCRHTSCSIVTRADHTRSSDRRWDLAVPVRFR